MRLGTATPGISLTSYALGGILEYSMVTGYSHHTTIRASDDIAESMAIAWADGVCPILARPPQSGVTGLLL
jgi:hypothetical protein